MDTTCSTQGEVHEKFRFKTPKGRDHLEQPVVYGRILVILQWSLEKQGEKCGMDSAGSGLDPVVDSREHGNP
jgi:hypothetical protein